MLGSATRLAKMPMHFVFRRVGGGRQPSPRTPSIGNTPTEDTRLVSRHSLRSGSPKQGTRVNGFLGSFNSPRSFSLPEKIRMFPQIMSFYTRKIDSCKGTVNGESGGVLIFGLPAKSSRVYYVGGHFSSLLFFLWFLCTPDGVPLHICRSASSGSLSLPESLVQVST